MGTPLQGLLPQLGRRQVTVTSRHLDSRFSLSHLPHLILPLKSYVGFSPLPQMPFLLQLSTTLAALPLKPSRLLCPIYLAYSSCPNTISSLSQPYFH